MPTLTRRDIDDAAIEWVKAALADRGGDDHVTQVMIDAAEQEMFTTLFGDGSGAARGA